MVCLALLVGVVPFGASRVKNACSMTRMRPSYHPVKIRDFAGVYGLIRYEEVGMVTLSEEAAVLFLPGNAGSYEQVRSLGSELAKVGIAAFAVDSRGELAAFDGRLLRRQIRFARGCVRFLRKRYEKVVVVGHSIGGVAASRASRGPVVTLAAPHAAHPLAMASIYRRMVPRAVSVLSISGGPRDWHVPDWVASAPGNNNNNTTVFRHLPVADIFPSISTDHQCALWCNEIMRLLADAIHRWTLDDSSPRLLDVRGVPPFVVTTKRSQATTLAAAWPFLVNHLSVGASQLSLWLLPRAPPLFASVALAPFTFAVVAALGAGLRELLSGATLLIAAVAALLVGSLGLVLAGLPPLLEKKKSRRPRENGTRSLPRFFFTAVAVALILLLRLHPAPCLLLAAGLVHDDFARSLYAAAGLSLAPSFVAVAGARGPLPPPALRSVLLAIGPLSHALLLRQPPLFSTYLASLACVAAAVFASPDALLDAALVSSLVAILSP